MTVIEGNNILKARGETLAFFIYILYNNSRNRTQQL